MSTVVLSTKTQDHSHIERYHGSRLLRVPVGSGDLPSRLQAFERAVRRQLESEEYGIAHFTDPFGGYVLSELRAQYGYKLVYEANAFPSQDLRSTHPALEQDRRFLARVRRQELFCLMNADRVLVGSELTRRHVQALGVAGEQVEVLRAPVDLGPYAPGTVGEPDGSPMRLVYLGSQVPWQGLPTLLRALAKVNHTADVRLAVVGPPHPDHQLRLIDLTDELHLTEKVAFQAPVGHDELPKVLANADGCVAPLEDVDRNRLQGSALAKVSDYLAAGRPILASDVPIARELVPASCGLFFKAGSVDELAARILELERDPERRVQLGRRARAEARAVDAVEVTRKLLAIYDGLIGSAAGESTESSMAASHPTLTATPTSRLGPSRTEPARAPASGLGSNSAETDKTRPAEPPTIVASAMMPIARQDVAKDPSRIDTDPAGRPPALEPTPIVPAPTPPPPRIPVPTAATARPATPPVLAPRPARLRMIDEPEEISPDEVVEADEVSMVSRVTRMDPWFAQLAHGYCPPEGIQFGRHTPPTTMPGREEPLGQRSDAKPSSG